MDEHMLESAVRTLEMLHQAELGRVRRAAAVDLGQYWTGHCWYCHAPVEHPRRWCGVECRDAWERWEANHVGIDVDDDVGDDGDDLI